MDDPRLRIRLFGRFHLQLAGQQLAALPDRRGDQVLAYLLVHHSTTVQSRDVAAAIWAEEASVGNLEAAEHRLRQSLSALRKNLGSEEGRIHVAHRSISFDVREASIDLVEFDRAVEEVLSGSRPFDVETVVRKLRWYEEGTLLESWEEVWVDGARTKRRDRYAAAIERLLDRHRHALSTRELSGLLWQLVKHRPNQEAGWRELLQLLLDTGERMQASQVARRCEQYYEKVGLALPRSTRMLLDRALSSQAALGLPTDELEALEPIGGAMPTQSPYYIERDADAHLGAAIVRRDCIILIKGSRQVGKTSLLARGLQRARQSGARVVLTDLQRFTTHELAAEEQFFGALATDLAEQVAPHVAWQRNDASAYPPSRRFERFVRQVLQDIGRPLVWGLDEVDRLLPCDFRNTVFGLLRSWYNERALEPDGPFALLTLVMAYATEPYLFVSDLNQSPFNVGTRLLLQDLTREQVGELNHRYKSPFTEPEEVDALYELLRGQPFLTRLALHEVSTGHMPLHEMEASGLRGIGPFAEHLNRMLASLEHDDTGLVNELRSVLRGMACSQQGGSRLRSAGVVCESHDGDVRLRCPLYHKFLSRRLL